MVKCILADKTVDTAALETTHLLSLELKYAPVDMFWSVDDVDLSDFTFTAYYGTSKEVSGSTTITANFTYELIQNSNFYNIVVNYFDAGYSATTTLANYVFNWGSETATGNSTWWSDLQTAVKRTTDLSSLIGKKKLTSLSTAVLGANAATMVCIGANQDGDNTLTFQTAGLLPTSTVFGSSAVWIGSTARTQCQNFYNYCSAKSAIKSVSKGTCATQTSSQNGTATYNTETVWLPSEIEMGLNNYSSLNYSHSTTSNSECTKGYNAPYTYYNSDSKRIKCIMAANGTVGTSTGYYWERSRNYGSSAYVCVVITNGGASYYNYNYSGYLAPAFVIG